ncbi:hypothetical protein [Aureispira anguillae]|uniref:Uncharacterized protein n=1 Tax=Aureispira anguillae TaxID=2864201 RepID=A0A916DWE8_9BACT|nr:hypothetical protein [Aureispira anguillae]BDS15396.1 hypothetical protein AsAng_0061800 [Aureispira anguillae]
MPNEKLIRAINKLKKKRGRMLVFELGSQGIQVPDEVSPEQLVADILAKLDGRTSVDNWDEFMRTLYVNEGISAEEMEELGETYTRVMKEFTALQESPFDVALVEKLELRMREWLTAIEQLENREQRRFFEAKYALVEEGLRLTIPGMVDQARAFCEVLAQDDMDLATISADELLAGLKVHYRGAEDAQKEVYLDRLKQELSEVDSFSEAAFFLFGADEEGVAHIDVFLRTKKIVKKYPSDTIGTYYRGDSRMPKQITNGQGFTARTIMTTEEARAEVQRWFGEGLGPVAYHEDWIRNKAGSNKIATGNDIGCMGYGCVGIGGANQNVYQIVVPGGLQEVAITEDVIGVPPHANQKPKLLLDTGSLATANVIAVVGSLAAETTFFTSIPSDWIEIIYEHTGDDEVKGGGRGWT